MRSSRPSRLHGSRGDGTADPVRSVPRAACTGSVCAALTAGRWPGDPLNTVAGGRVTAKLVFTFRDGSVLRDGGVLAAIHFKLITDHLVRRAGVPARSTSRSTGTGEVTVRYTNDHGEEKVESGAWSYRRTWQTA
jgi:hypothetical protein